VNTDGNDFTGKARFSFCRLPAGAAGEVKPFSRGRAPGVALIALSLLAFALAAVNLVYARAARPKGNLYTVEISPAASINMLPIVESYINTHANGRMKLSSGGGADVFIDEKPRKGYNAVRVTGVPAITLAAGTLRKTLRNARSWWLCSKRAGIILKQPNPEIESLADYITDYYGADSSVKLTALGDIIPGRHVAKAMAKHGVAFPFKLATPLVKGSDVTVGDLECPLTDRVEPPYSGMFFSSPTKTVEGLKLLGISVVTLANNHSTNFGRPAFTDTLETLKANDIKYAGGGYNYDEAHRPAVVEARGLKFAFLSYNSIEGSLDATADEPGVTWIRMPPYNPDNPDDVKKVVDDIGQARRQADIVIACFHWSKEYEYHPNPSMVVLAHAACDAGADLVIGQHPHSVQSIEYYKGKFIAYSLGNFIFDQRHVQINGVDIGEQTRKGLVLKCDFRRGFLASLELLPCRINDNCQTAPLEGKSAQNLLDKVFSISGWKQQGTSI